jgi:hypothetical protein
MPPGDALAAMVLFPTIGTIGAIVVPLELGRAPERAMHDRGGVRRLGEVEECQEFTERMIAQRADPGRMAHPRGSARWTPRSSGF